MTVYRYSGPMTAMEIRGVGEVTFVHGRLYDLPSDAPNVKHLAARGEAAARGRKVVQGRLTPATPGNDEIVRKPAIVERKPSSAPDRNMLADTIKVMTEGLKHPDVAAEAQKAIGVQLEAAAKKKAAATPKPKEG